MEVFKFGGASLQTVERIKNVVSIVENNRDKNLVVVVSAMGKTTNALEKVAEAFYAGQAETALQLFADIKQQHLTIAQQLLTSRYSKLVADLESCFTEVEWLLHDSPVKSFDYYYDQVVCTGEILSSQIISAYMSELRLENFWFDVRDVLRTDDNFRNANIDWQVTAANVERLDELQHAGICVTQGFVGATDQNESTTLGREGSDFTAAIFANLLNAEKLTIWKDVDGVMNADPRLFANARLIPRLSYHEIIEMAFYGAQVIHPKTIKPLQNKHIQLWVKSFVQPLLPGTVIDNFSVKNLPPILVVKSKQVVLHLQTIDYSFVGGRPMATLYQVLAELSIKANLIQSGAIDVLLCVDDWPAKIDELAGLLAGVYTIHIEKDLSLLTIRHYTPKILADMLTGKTPVLTQKTTETVQVLYRD